MSMGFVAATPHAAATEAGIRAFEAGGNAVDAAVAASITLAVVYPHMCGIGGDLFAVVADSNTRIVVNGSGAAPAGIDAGHIRHTQGMMPQYGALTISVPGAAAAWASLIDRFGRLPLAAAFSAAIRWAREGVPLARSVAGAIAAHGNRISRDPGLRALLHPSGVPLRRDDRLSQPALAETLEALATAGAAAFYDGLIGERLTEGLDRLGSPLTMADFRRHATEFTEPLIGRYRGYQVLVPPPNSQGFVLLELLTATELGGIDPDHLGKAAPTLMKLFGLASADRDTFLADPRAASVPTAWLLSGQRADELLRAVGKPISLEASPQISGDTVGVVTAEEDGLWVALNQSLYEPFGSGILEPVTGILCHNRASAFSLDAHHPNGLTGGKRPAHTLMPVMVLEDGKPVVAAATRGGKSHPQIHAELLMAILDRGLDVDAALGLPRWLVASSQKDGNRVQAESRVPSSVTDSFQAAGMPVERLDAWDERVGHAQVIRRNADGSLCAGSDRRADGSVGFARAGSE